MKTATSAPALTPLTEDEAALLHAIDCDGVIADVWGATSDLATTLYRARHGEGSIEAVVLAARDVRDHAARLDFLLGEGAVR
ncbi:MAG: hypothetical protein ABUL47_05710 [Leifsonia sp.]